MLAKRIRTLVSNIGSPYGDDVFEGTIEDGDPEKRRPLTEFAVVRQPASFLFRFFPRAVLFQAGGLDPHMNVGRVKDFSRRLQKFNAAAPERVRDLEFPGITHAFSPKLWENSLAWFERFL